MGDMPITRRRPRRAVSRAKWVQFFRVLGGFGVLDGFDGCGRVRW